MPIPDVEALLHLLSAPSKNAVDSFLCSCAREREALQSNAARLAELAATFGGLSEPDAKRLHGAGCTLVNEAVYTAVSSADQISEFLGPEFHADLAGLLSKVILHRIEDWRAESLALGGVSSMPRLHKASWQEYRAAASPSPSLLLSLELGDVSRGSGDTDSKVHLEMSKEQLDAMLATLTKVKEQLDAV